VSWAIAGNAGPATVSAVAIRIVDFPLAQAYTAPTVFIWPSGAFLVVALNDENRRVSEFRCTQGIERQLKVRSKSANWRA
jgi:hypothetical protein